MGQCQGPLHRRQCRCRIRPLRRGCPVSARLLRRRPFQGLPRLQQRRPRLGRGRGAPRDQPRSRYQHPRVRRSSNCRPPARGRIFCPLVDRRLGRSPDQLRLSVAHRSHRLDGRAGRRRVSAEPHRPQAGEGRCCCRRGCRGQRPQAVGWPHPGSRCRLQIHQDNSDRQQVRQVTKGIKEQIGDTITSTQQNPLVITFR